MTPSNPRLGIQIILKGDLKNLKRGDYLITPKKMEIKNESK
jgi:FtsZ-interacting cell division protein YlmF